MRQVSEITGKEYEDSDMVHFRNYVQSAYYISWSCRLIDLFVDNNKKLVFVFSKKDHERVKHRWINQQNVK